MFVDRVARVGPSCSFSMQEVLKMCFWWCSNAPIKHLFLSELGNDKSLKASLTVLLTAYYLPAKKGSNARLNMSAGASEIVEEVQTLIVLYFIHIKQSATYLTLLYTHIHLVCSFILQSSKFRRFGLALAPGMNPPRIWPSWPVPT